MLQDHNLELFNYLYAVNKVECLMHNTEAANMN